MATGMRLPVSANDLTASNLDVANARVVEFLRRIYPSLDVGELTEISQIPLLDITDLENAAVEDLTEVALVVSSVACGVAAFVDARNSERRLISQVLDEFSAEIVLNREVGSGPLI